MLACCATGCTTALGALPVLFIKREVSQRLMSSLLGFAAGIMLAATCFSLIVPALEHHHGGIVVTYAALSGMVEPVMGFIGLLAVRVMTPLLLGRWPLQEEP